MAKKAKAKKSKVPKLVKSYVGIIDTAGLDRFSPLTPSELSLCRLRAQCNPQRHACVFIADFPEDLEVAEHIKKLGDPWDMWNYILLVCTELKSQPEDAKTIKNMKKLSEAIKKHTGRTY